MATIDSREVSLVAKLHPSRFEVMGFRLGLMLSFVLEQDWNFLVPETISLTSDGYLVTGEGFVIGHLTDWVHSRDHLFDAAGVSRCERAWFDCMFWRRIGKEHTW